MTIFKQLKEWYRNDSVEKGRFNKHKDILSLCLFLNRVTIISSGPLHTIFMTNQNF